MWKIVQFFSSVWNKIYDSQNSYLLCVKTCISSHFGIGPRGTHPAAAAVLYLINSWRRETLKVPILFVHEVGDKTMPFGFASTAVTHHFLSEEYDHDCEVKMPKIRNGQNPG